MNMEAYLRGSQSAVQAVLNQAKEIAKYLPLEWTKGVEVVLRICLGNPQLSPHNVQGVTGNDILRKWLLQYKKGLEQRASARASEMPGTVPDSIVDDIIGTRLPHLGSGDLQRIKFGHRLSMSGENTLGLLLEDYLAGELVLYGWHCCWGATLRCVDFCHEDGRLLQIKNRSNSENSSSSRVREGTGIQAWYRVVATTGAYKWPDLNRLVGCNHLSEENFRGFVNKVVLANPHLVPIESDNPWLDH